MFGFFLSLGHGILIGFSLDAFEVKRANIAAASVVGLNKIAKLVREEFFDNLVIGDGTLLDS